MSDFGFGPGTCLGLVLVLGPVLENEFSKGPIQF